jgi:recombination protein RecA
MTTSGEPIRSSGCSSGVGGSLASGMVNGQNGPRCGPGVHFNSAVVVGDNGVGNQPFNNVAGRSRLRERAAMVSATMIADRESESDSLNSAPKVQSPQKPSSANKSANKKVPSPMAKKAKSETSKSKGSDLQSPLQKILDANSNLKTAFQQIEKTFGDGSIMSLSETSNHDIKAISTGSLSLDMALGGGGLPVGRVIEVYGPESSGKTTLALHVIASAQKSGGVAAFIDAEHAFDPRWGRKLGVQLQTLLVSQPNSGEEAMQICEMLVKSNAVDVVVIDSVAALVPQKELDGEIGDSHVGLQARLMSQALRKLTGAISRSKTCVVFINQIRDKIGVSYGSPETTPGGRALKFYASCRVDVRRVGALKDGEEVVGQRVRCKIVKNKVAPPFRVAEFDMMHSNGISYEGDVLDLGILHKIVAKSGAWFKYNDELIGQGKEKARAYLQEHPAVCQEICDKIMESGGYVEEVPPTAEAVDDEE